MDLEWDQKKSPKIKVEAKESSHETEILKDNFMVRYFHRFTFLNGVSSKQYEDFQISLSWWVQFAIQFYNQEIP